MREFTLDLTKFLSKGLSPIEDREGVIPGLYECHNFVPDEAGLKPWVPLRPTGWRGAFFNYLPIRDQTGKLWYYYPVFDGHILVGDQIPSEPSTSLLPVPVVGIPVQWIEVFDENGDLWKIYPDPAEGFTRATDSTPLSGVGIQDLVWRGTTTELWTNRFDNASKTRYAVRVKG